jgi:hypothetical protein
VDRSEGTSLLEGDCWAVEELSAEVLAEEVARSNKEEKDVGEEEEEGGEADDVVEDGVGLRVPNTASVRAITS